MVNFCCCIPSRDDMAKKVAGAVVDDAKDKVTGGLKDVGGKVKPPQVQVPNVQPPKINPPKIPGF